jgi:hypothetical protein
MGKQSNSQEDSKELELVLSYLIVILGDHGNAPRSHS